MSLRVGNAGGDPSAALLAIRLERHLRGDADAIRGKGILVARSRRAKDAGGLDLQIAAVLAAIQTRLGDALDERPLIVLAHDGLVSRLRVLLAPSSSIIANVVGFEAEGEPSAAIRILEAQEFVDEFDQRMTSALKTGTILKPDQVQPKRRATTLRPGGSIGNYDIVRRLGGGGFGDVYEAQGRQLKNRVAIKVLRSDAAELGPEQLDAFREEAVRLTKLENAHIVNSKSFDEAADGTLYLVMEYVDGEELDKVLKKSSDRRLPPRRVQKLLLQMLDGLRAAHDVGDGQGILHLDLKPNNVFVVPGRGGEDHVKLIDFGIGQFVGGDATQSSRPPAAPRAAENAELDLPQGTITLGRLLLGKSTMRGVRRVEACTPEYAAPELGRHVLGDEDIVALDGRADLYSLGVMAFMMLTGRLPFPPVDSRFDVVRQHVVSDPEKVGASGVRVPRDLARFIDKLMARDRDQRWKSADEAWRELDAIVHPPAWKLGIRVAAVVMVLAAALAWFTRPETRNAVTLWSVPTSGDPIKADGQALHFGPERKATRLRLEARDVDWKSVRGTPLRLESTSGDALPASWSIAWSNVDRLNEVVVAHDGSARTRTASKARIAGDFGDLSLGQDVVELVWLGSEAWSIEQVRAGEDVLSPSTSKRVDPEGLAISARLGGAGLVPRDVYRATLTLGEGSSPMDMTVTSHAEGGVVCTVDLPWPWSLPMTVEPKVTVIDHAATARDAIRALEIVTEQLELELVLIDAARGTVEKPAECVRSGGGYLLTPEARPQLVAKSNRPVKPPMASGRVNSDALFGLKDLAWSEPILEGGRSVRKADIGALLEGLNERDSGSVTLQVEESDTARTTASRTRGRATTTFEFAFTKETAAVSLHSSGRPLASEKWYTNATKLDFALRTESKVPILARWRLRAPGNVEQVAWEVVQGSLKSQPGLPREEALSVRLDDEGEYTLEVEAYRAVQAGANLSSEPESKATSTWIVARKSPTLRWRTDGPPQQIRAASDLDKPLGLLVLDRGSDAPTSNLGVRLARRTEPARQPDVITSRIVALDEVLTLRELFGGTGGPGGQEEDGAYELSVEGFDAAGNRIAPAAFEFGVSLQGPEFDALISPLSGVTWDRDPSKQGWIIRVRIEDPNGINLASIRATIQCEGETEDKWRLVQALSAESAGSEVRPVVVATGLVAFPEDWSSRRIAITLDAKDRLGTTRSKTYPSIELSDTRRVLPGRIAHLDPRGAGSSMRLVSGNDGAVYTFGGRGDDVETELYRRAGLGSFKRGRVVGEESAKLDFGDAVIRDFYLDEDEVTRGEFLTFVRAAESGYLDPKFWPSGGRPDPARSKSWLELAADGSDDRLPITGVTWDEAAAFARWMHKRLPSLVEWEYVVRGGAGNYRPFSSWDSMRPRPAHEIVNFRSSTNGAGRAPWARGSGAEVSSEGFRNLSGNVREWTSTPREIPGEKETEPRTLMSKYKEIWLDPLRLGESLKQVGRFYVAGGAWDMTEFDFATWKVFPRGEPRPNVGFRCAVSSAEVRAGLGDRWGSAP